jgi:acetate CoA/acetoacetate CoA-transferase alpha subunit
MKIIELEKAISTIKDGSSLMVSGFLGFGSPEEMMDELVKQGKKELTIISNDSAFPESGIGKIIVAKLVKKLITSHMGTNPETQRQMINGELEVELVPQGTFAERIRAGGVGLGGILTPTGVGTLVQDGKKILEVDGKKYLLELPLRADFALLKAKKADYLGNLYYSLTARNFNPLMAMAADVVIAEVEEIVPTGAIPPEEVHTPHVLVDYVVVEGRK